jgi:hypothetical protein
LFDIKPIILHLLKSFTLYLIFRSLADLCVSDLFFPLKLCCLIFFKFLNFSRDRYIQERKLFNCTIELLAIFFHLRSLKRDLVSVLFHHLYVGSVNYIFKSWYSYWAKLRFFTSQRGCKNTPEDEVAKWVNIFYIIFYNVV